MSAALQLLDRAAIEATPRAIEDAIATAFAIRHADELRYCHDWKAWLRWDGTRWEPERRKLAFHYARELAREANQENKAAPAKASTAAGVERFAQADPRLSIVADDWDQNPWLLATPSGTVDLRTGEMQPARRQDFITKRTNVTPGGDPDLWLRFLYQATGGEVKLASYLKRVVGYCLTGDVTEETLFFIFGPGGNGKGVFLETIIAAIGDYAKTSDMATFTAAKGDRHTTDMAMLCGARLVTAEETEKGSTWAETRIKVLTGGGKITARFMHRDNFTFDPTFKLLLGCLEWQAEGLQPPESVLAASEEYFAEQDILGRWLEECCTLEPRGWELGSRLYCSWSDYARQCGEEPGSTKAFGGTLTGLGFRPDREYVNGHTQRVHCGLRLR